MVMLLEVPLFLVIIIDLGSARAINGANKDDVQLSAELDPSKLQGTLCNDNKVKVICYMRRNNGQNVPLNHLNCKWTCTRGINNQKEGMTIFSYGPMYILSKNLEVPAQCKCSCKDPQGGEDKTAYLNISGHGPPIIKIHHSIPPVEGDSYAINATITTDIPFTSDGYPAWESLSSRWTDSSSYENQTYFMELFTRSFSAATDGGKYTITAANECGKSSRSILIGVKNDSIPSPPSKDDSTPYPDNSSGHGKGPLSTEDIIIVGILVIIIGVSVIIFLGLVVISWKNGKNNVTASGESRGTLQGITEGRPVVHYGATGNTEGGQAGQQQQQANSGTTASTSQPTLVTTLDNPSYINLLPIIQHVVDWKLLGAYLLPEEYIPRLLNDIERTHKDRVGECREALLREYLRVGDVSWGKVIDSLEKSHHPNVAKMIKQ